MGICRIFTLVGTQWLLHEWLFLRISVIFTTSWIYFWNNEETHEIIPPQWFLLRDTCRVPGAQILRLFAEMSHSKNQGPGFPCPWSQCYSSGRGREPAALCCVLWTSLLTTHNLCPVSCLLRNVNLQKVKVMSLFSLYSVLYGFAHYGFSVVNNNLVFLLGSFW